MSADIAANGILTSIAVNFRRRIILTTLALQFGLSYIDLILDAATLKFVVFIGSLPSPTKPGGELCSDRTSYVWYNTTIYYI